MSKEMREQIENALMVFAKLFDMEKTYADLIDSGTELPKLVEMISHEMFVRQFNSSHCNSRQLREYRIILQYAKHLKVLTNV